MNDFENRLMDYGLHLMQQATGAGPGAAGDVTWAGAFEARMGAKPGAQVPAGPCRTIFTRVRLGMEEPPTTCWRPALLAAGGPAMLPTSLGAAEAESRAALAETFTRAVVALERDGSWAFTRFYHLMQLCASTLPNSYREPGSTLFQQWKMVAALAKIAEDATTPPDKVLLIAGDLPGIQRAIYTVTSKGAAKTLRGRSFFVQLLGDAIVRRLLGKMGLCEANVVYDAGGNFLLLASAGAAEKAEQVRDEANERLLEAFEGSLQLALVWETAEIWMLFDHTEFPSLRESLGKALAEAKNRPFAGLAGKWERLWKPYGTGGVAHCAVTGADLPDGGVPLGPTNEPGEGDVRVTPLVKSLYDLGYQIRHARLQMHLEPDSASLGLPVDYGDGWDDVLAKISGYRYAFAEMPVLGGAPRVAAGSMAYAFNEPEAVAHGYHGFRFVANVAPHVTDADIEWWKQEHPEEAAPERGDIRGFAMLAHAAVTAGAIERVGVLRMDVDRLGLLVAGEKSRFTVTLLSELSGALDRFFSGRLNEIVRSAAGNDAYVIYAGGDDLFITGAWHVLPALAEKIRDEFATHTGENSDLTISGGITLEQSKFPVYRAADRAGEAVQQAKDYVRYRRYEDGRLMLDDDGERQEARGKDALCFLGTAVGWEEWEIVRKEMEAIRAVVQEGPTGKSPAPRAIIHVIQTLHRDYRDDLTAVRKAYRAATRAHGSGSQAGGKAMPPIAPDERQFYGRWRWMQDYAMSRMADRCPARGEEIREIQQGLLQLDTVRLAGLAARWAEYCIRKEA